MAGLGLHRRVLVPAITTAAVTGLLTIITCVSYPAVIFSGDLAAHLPLGIGAALVSAIVLGVVIVLFVAYPAVIPYAQFEPNVVIAVIVATAATTLTDAGRGDAILPTIIILMPLCTLLIGNLIRYAPFPVIAWLLAGVGWFLIRAAFSSAAGRPLEWDTIGSFGSRRRSSAGFQPLSERLCCGACSGGAATT